MSDPAGHVQVTRGGPWSGVLEEHLRCVPAFRALIRTIECRLVHEAGPLPPPLLDVGCGDGLFAEMAFVSRIEAGVDADAARLRETRQRGAHAVCVCAGAEALPFATGHFGTVLANCVLEHVEPLERALREISRVVRPGGRLIFGVPGPEFAPFLAGSRLMRGVGLVRAADAYGAWFHRHSRHFHVHGEAEWRTRLARHGFTVERCRPYMSRTAHGRFDLAHYLSVPRLVRWRLTGRWVGRPDGPVNRLWARWLSPSVVADPSDGAYLFFEARRTSEFLELSEA